MNSKNLTFIIIMGILGNILFAVSNYAGTIIPGVALDFSLIAVYIAGFFGGPTIGFISGLFAGIFPGIIFGPLGMGSWLGLFGLPLGKAITGLSAGLISKGLHLNKKDNSIPLIPVTLLSYIPEGIYTYAYFAFLMPFFLGSEALGSVFIIYILPKAIVEVTIISFLMAALQGNTGFKDFVSNYF